MPIIFITLIIHATSPNNKGKLPTRAYRDGFTSILKLLGEGLNTVELNTVELNTVELNTVESNFFYWTDHKFTRNYSYRWQRRFCTTSRRNVRGFQNAC